MLPPPLPVLPRAAQAWTAAHARLEDTGLSPRETLHCIGVGLSMRGRAASVNLWILRSVKS